jgi:hypothetical protein
MQSGSKLRKGCPRWLLLRVRFETGDGARREAPGIGGLADVQVALVTFAAHQLC